MVRAARPDEYDAVGRLTVAAFGELAPVLSEAAWAEYQQDLADVARRAERGVVLVAAAGDELLGAVSYYPPMPRPAGNTWWWWPEAYAYLRALAVPPAARRRGIGRLLTQACIQRARSDGAAGIALNTSPLMVVAQGIYERMGFRHVADAGAWEGLRMLSYVMDFAPATGPPLAGPPATS